MIPLAERYRLPISQRTRVLLVAIILVLLAGVAIAAIQPGNIGDDDEETAAEITTTTTTDDDGGPTTTAAEVTTTTEGGTGAVDETGDSSPSATEAPSSGLGTNGSGSAGDEDLADTGGPPLVVPGALLLAAAAVSRRLLAR